MQQPGDARQLATQHEVEYFIQRYYETNGVFESSLVSEVNLDRTYIYRMSPINLDLIDERYVFNRTQAQSKHQLTDIIFRLPASSLSLVTLDLRHTSGYAS